MNSLIETLEKKYSQEDKGPRPLIMARLIKPANVLTWMSLKIFRRQIDNRQTNSRDVPENTQFQDLVESLKHNEDIKGLVK